MNVNRRNSGRGRCHDFKLVSAVVGASAILAIGAMCAALHEERSGTVNASGSMQLGGTSTQGPPPTTLTTTLAVPVVKAKPYK
jgi:hypothetical protein